MSRRDEPISPAVVPPWAAYVIVRDFPEVLKLLESKGQSLRAAGQRAEGAQLLMGVAFLRKAAREQREAAGVAVSAVGSAEVPRGAAEGVSERPPSDGLTTQEVVERFRLSGLEISDRQVRNLCRPGGGLSATRAGRTWLVDAVSVAADIERRQADRER